MARSAWFVNNLSNGQFAVEDMCISTGARWFVHSGTGTDGTAYGKGPDTPFATIDYAIGNCTANKGDLILVMPGHAETLASAGAITADIAGVTIRGLGNGTNIPTLSFSNTASSIVVSAAGVTFQNLRVTPTVDEVVKMFNVTGAYCTIDNVEHVDNTSTPAQTIQFLLTTAAADYLTIKNCKHYQSAAANSAQAWIQLVGTDRTTIEDNTFFLTLNNAAGSMPISGSTAVVMAHIQRNKFIVLGGTSIVNVVNCVTGSTGMINDNRAYTATGVSTASAFVGDAMGMSQNYWSDTAAASGLLAPAVDTDT